MNSFKDWFQDPVGLTRRILLLFAGLNLYSAYRMLFESLLLVLAHVVVAVVLLLGVVLFD